MKGLSAAFIMALLFSAIALFQFASSASANPMDGTPVPPAFQTPNKDPPRLTIQSPLNNTSSENDVWLNFTVTQPDSWFEPDVVCYIRNITYQIDEGQAIVLYTPTPSEHELPVTKQFSVVLNSVPVGQHTVQIKVSAESQYLPNYKYYWFLVKHYPLRVSQTIIFTVQDLTPTPTPEHSLSIDPNFSFYTGLTLMTITVAAFAGVLIYLKKRKR